MRVISLLPAATEIVAALGAGGRLVGVTHECDCPPEVRVLPRVTRSRRDRAPLPGPASPGARMARPALRRGALGPRADRDRGGRGRRRRSRRAVRDALVAGAQRPGARSRGRRAVWLRRRAGAPRGGPGHGPRRAGAARPARRVSRRQRLYLAPGAAPGRRRGNARAVDARLTVARRFVEIRWL